MKKYEYRKMYKKQYYIKNAERIKTTRKDWYLKNKARAKATSLSWYHNFKGKRKLTMFKYFLKKQYGITPEQYATILYKQDGKCAICKTNRAKMCVDHCHTTGVVRGILCTKCNLGIGLLCDNEIYLYSAIKYLNLTKSTKDVTI